MTDHPLRNAHPELVRNKAGQWEWANDSYAERDYWIDRLARQQVVVPKDAVIDVQKITHGGTVIFYSKAARHIHAFVDPPGARRARVRWIRWAKRYLKLVRWMGLDG